MGVVRGSRGLTIRARAWYIDGIGAGPESWVGPGGVMVMGRSWVGPGGAPVRPVCDVLGIGIIGLPTSPPQAQLG